ncbi:MAG: type IV pilin-like G/H family protein [Halothece sp.]
MLFKKSSLIGMSAVAATVTLAAGCTNNQPIDNAQVQTLAGTWEVTSVSRGETTENLNGLVQLEPSQGRLIGVVLPVGVVELIPAQGNELTGQVYIFGVSDRAVTIPATANLGENEEQLTLLIQGSEVDQASLPPQLQNNLTDDVTLIATKMTEPLSSLPPNQAPEVEGRNVIGALTRAEQAYYLENQRFTEDIEELGLGMNPENYAFDLNLLGETGVQTIAIPEQEGLKSYTGGVFFVNNAYEVVVCESVEPSQEEPEAPQLVGNEAQCPSGFNPLQ